MTTTGQTDTHSRGILNGCVLLKSVNARKTEWQIILLFGAFISLKVLVSNPTEKDNIKKMLLPPQKKKKIGTFPLNLLQDLFWQGMDYVLQKAGQSFCGPDKTL